MGGVGLINFLVIPFYYQSYANGVEISSVEIKESATPQLYTQIKSAFDYNKPIYPIGFIFDEKYINVDDESNPYFIGNNITAAEIDHFIVPYRQMTLYHEGRDYGGENFKTISFHYYESVNEERVEIRYYISDKRIFVSRERA